MLSFERSFLPILIFDASQKLDLLIQKQYHEFERQTRNKFQAQIVEIAVELNIHVPANMKKASLIGKQKDKQDGGEVEFESLNGDDTNNQSDMIKEKIRMY